MRLCAAPLCGLAHPCAPLCAPRARSHDPNTGFPSSPTGTTGGRAGNSRRRLIWENFGGWRPAGKGRERPGKAGKACAPLCAPRPPPLCACGPCLGDQRIIRDVCCPDAALRDLQPECVSTTLGRYYPAYPPDRLDSIGPMWLIASTTSGQWSRQARLSACSGVVGPLRTVTTAVILNGRVVYWSWSRSSGKAIAGSNPAARLYPIVFFWRSAR